MNAPLSILIYNMIEAMLLLYCLFKFDKNNIGKRFKFYKPKTIGVAYLLGIVNYLFQAIPYLFDNMTIRFYLSIIVCIIIMPIILKVFIGKEVWKCFVSCLYCFITLCFYMYIWNKIIGEILIIGNNDVLNEFLFNISSKILQFIIFIGGIKCLSSLKTLWLKAKFRRSR